MRNFLLGILIAAVAILGYLYIKNSFYSHQSEIKVSEMISNQMQQVGKLIVTEGHFSEVITYKDAKKFYLDILTAEKKVIVVVNAKATIAYDLSDVIYTIDTDTKTILVTHIPAPEINIYPDIKYHDLEQNYFNEFTTEDHNLIRKKVLTQLHSKIQESSLSTNASNRLISELHKIFILTNTLDWKLTYKETPIQSLQDIETILLRK